MPRDAVRREPATETDGLKSRAAALRQAAALPDTELRVLLDAALAELDAAMTALAAAGGQESPDSGGQSAEAMRSERRLLQAVFQQAPVALFLLGKDGTVRRANSASADLVGARPGYATGKLFTALIDPRSRAAAQSQLAAVARTGDPHQLDCGLLGSSGLVPCQLAIRAVSVRGDDDRLLVAATPDSAKGAGDGKTAAARRPSGQRAVTASLARSGRTSGSADQPDTAADLVTATMTRRLDLVTAINRLLLENVAASEAVTLQRFGRLLADNLATWVIIDTKHQGRLRRHSVAGPDEEESAARAQAIMAVHPRPESASGQVDMTGSAMLLAHVEDHEILGVAEDGVPLFLLLRGASALCVPIAAAGIAYGALTLVKSAAAGTFGLGEMGLAEEAAEQLARAMTVHRIVERRTEVAEALQDSLLPRELRPIPGVDVAAAHMAPTLGHEVGGDFYDIYPTPEGWGIAIGDVCGKGEDAAAVTAAARHAIRVLAHGNADPAGVLRAANDIMLAEEFDGRFVTADAAHLSWRDDRLRVVLGSAGHPGPVLVTPDGRAQVIEGGGVPLGIFSDGEVQGRELELAPGDVLFFCTDGLTGARSPDAGSFGERLADGLAGLAGRAPAEMIAGLQRLLVEFCDGILLDDVTMLALRVGQPPSASQPS